MPALLAHSDLVLGYMPKILALYTYRGIITYYFCVGYYVSLYIVLFNATYYYYALIRALDLPLV
jgi:hypothetical protein